jgi:hypothetical protein
MTASYIVFQYVPDAASDECINFGVATRGDEGFHARFLHDWRRVAAFAGASDVRFLREFGGRVEACGDQPTLWNDPDAQVRLLFEDAPRRWINSIRVTTPRASTRASDDLVDEIARRFLKGPARRHRGRDRRWIRGRAYVSLLAALESAGVADPDDHVVRGASLDGVVESHEFDVAAGNGHLVSAALALSFERQNLYDLRRDYAAAAWAIEDVRHRHGSLPLAVLMVPPVRGTSKTYEQARHVFEHLDAQPIAEGEVEDWADHVASAVAASDGAGASGA